MNAWDWGVIFLYFAAIIYFAKVFGRSQRNLRQYFLTGNKVRWWQSGLSTMATQLGAISFVSAPAFVALADGGGLKWLCYEFGVPIGIFFVMLVIVPILYRRRYISIYEYLEDRFDRSTRLVVSGLFQIGRALATAVSLLAGGLIVSTALSISTSLAIVVIGSITILYDALGGMRIVILSDVLQMAIIFGGIVLCAGVALHLVGWNEGWAALDPQRLRILDFRRAGLSPAGEYAFWPMTLGGIFLYASYYGCDQSQAQRQLSVGNIADANKALLLNALGRFPLVLLYCAMGVFVGALVPSTEGLERIAGTLGTEPAAVAGMLDRDPDRMLPMFILSYLPHGLIGLLLVAILSALMSSLDSAINSLSAVTVRDIYQPFLRKGEKEFHYLIASKTITAFWGLFCMAAALGFAGLGDQNRATTIVLINAVGSLLYGPILAAFFLGMVTRRLDAASVNWGISIGVLGNLCIWLLTEISWLWWNVTGFVLVSAVACVRHCLKTWRVKGVVTAPSEVRVEAPLFRHVPKYHYAVFPYVLFVIAVCWAIQDGGALG